MDLIGILREYKIGQIAVFDLVLAYVGIYSIAPFLTKTFTKIHLYINKTDWFWLTLPIGVLFHIVFAAQTPLTKMVLNPQGFYLIKLLILFMVFMGLRKSRKPSNIEISKSPSL